MDDLPSCAGHALECGLEVGLPHMSMGTSPLFAAGILTDPDAGKAAGTGLLRHRGWDFTGAGWFPGPAPSSLPNRRPGHPLYSRPTPPSWAVPLVSLVFSIASFARRPKLNRRTAYRQQVGAVWLLAEPVQKLPSLIVA